MAYLVNLSVCLVVFMCLCSAVVSTLPQPQRFHIRQRSPFTRTFRSFSSPSWRSHTFGRNSFRDFSDEDFDNFVHFDNFRNFGTSRNFRNSRNFGRSTFGNSFGVRHSRFFDDDDSFEHDD